MRGKYNKSIAKSLCKINTRVNTLEVDLTPITDLLTDILAEPDYELKWSPPSRLCLDGEIYTTFICQKFEDNVFVSSSIVVINPDGSLGTEVPPGAAACEVTDICNPWLGGGDSVALPTEGITDITFIFPSCNCSGVINTSIGSIPFNGMTELCFPSVNCPYTVTDITIEEGSTCLLEDIKWLASRKQ